MFAWYRRILHPWQKFLLRICFLFLVHCCNRFRENLLQEDLAKPPPKNLASNDVFVVPRNSIVFLLRQNSIYGEPVGLKQFIQLQFVGWRLVRLPRYLLNESFFRLKMSTIRWYANSFVGRTHNTIPYPAINLRIQIRRTKRFLKKRLKFRHFRGRRTAPLYEAALHGIFVLLNLFYPEISISPKAV